MNKSPSTSAIILAAGRGTRMRSNLPKVLHLLGGKSLIEHVLSTVSVVEPEQVLTVVGYKHDMVKEKFQDFLFGENFGSDRPLRVDFVHQEKQLGTGDAVKCAAEHLIEVDRVLVLNGDIPFISSDTISKLLTNTPAKAFGLLTAVMADPSGLGRIVRDKKSKKILSIVEEKDATKEQLKTNEINPGVYLIPKEKLLQWLPLLSAENVQEELYITDLVAQAISDGVTVHTEEVSEPLEAQGINTRVELSSLEREYQKRQAERHMLNGVTLADPARFEVRGDVKIAKDVEVDINVILEGTVIIEGDVSIGPNVCIKDSVIHAGSVILANSVIDGAVVGNDCHIGPFARIRPGTELQEKVKVGNFVEMKNSSIGAGSKANHLSYVGDAKVGSKVNIGAGTITCNYDGANKHQTVIEDEVFIGSNTQLVAPITVGKGSTVAAGTTITKNVPEGKLVLNSKETKIVAEWQRPHKNNVD